MKSRSCKAKGKRLTKLIKEKLHQWAIDLQDDDIKLPTTSEPGQDIHLSPAARLKYPFVIESKMVEKLNIGEAYKQAQTHTKFTHPEYRAHNQIPIVVHSKNRSPVLVTLDFEDLLWLIS